MNSSRRLNLLLGGGLLVGLLGAYGATLTGIVHRWLTDPKYSHGYFVPLFALWLLWSRWRRAPDSLRAGAFAGSWWGLPIFAGAIAAHLAGGYLFVDWIAEASLLLALVGLCLCVGGWPLARVAWPSIAFLAFMLPLPHRAEVSLAGPLQSIATAASAYLLQLLGFTAGTEGNIIVMNTARIGVVEACSGLGMLVTFFALSTAVAIVLKRPLLDKLVIVVSAIPIAVVANILRITVTGALMDTVGNRIAMIVYHDGAGYLMMTLALGLMLVELKVLSLLLVEVPAEVPGPVNIAQSLAPATPPARERNLKGPPPRRSERTTQR
jgi:exosortase